MNKIKIWTILSMAFIMTILSGCYGDMNDALSTYTVQAPLEYSSAYTNFRMNYNDTIFYNYQRYLTYNDGDKLYNMSQFNDPKIEKIEIYKVLTWMDYLSNYNFSQTNQESFESVETFIKFSDDPKTYTLFKFDSVKVREYYVKDTTNFKPMIYSVEQASSEIISKKIKAKTRFQIFSFMKNYKGTRTYSDIDFKVEASVRFTFKN